MNVRALLPLVLVCGCKETPTGAPPAPLPQVDIPIHGRVLDEQDAGIAGVQVLLFSSSDEGLPARRLALLSDVEGYFSGTTTSPPRVVSVGDGPAWYEFPGAAHAVDGGLGIEVRGRRIPHRAFVGVVVDAEQHPIAGAAVSAVGGGRSSGMQSDSEGHFEVLAEDSQKLFRVRKMGFRAREVDADQLAHVVLKERRPLITVKLLEANQEPARRLVSVTAKRGAEQLSFCTAGEARLTNEPRDGECTLDAEPGHVELRVDAPTGTPDGGWLLIAREIVQAIEVTDRSQSVTITLPRLPPPRPFERK